MSTSTRTLLKVLAVVALALLLTNGLILLGTDPDEQGLWLVWIAFGCILPFVLIYGFTVKWWTFWIGQALLISSIGFAALTGLIVLLRWLGPDYWGRVYVVNSVLTLVMLGAAWKLTAVLIDKIPLWLGRRRRHGADDANDTT